MTLTIATKRRPLLEVSTMSRLEALYRDAQDQLRGLEERIEGLLAAGDRDGRQDALLIRGTLRGLRSMLKDWAWHRLALRRPCPPPRRQ
jgi:hypothetical protein